MTNSNYSFVKDGVKYTVHTVVNKAGASMAVLDYGARLISLCVPDARGKMHDVIVGYKNAEEYIGDGRYFGATVGRFCNRIGNARYTLNGKTYFLEKNDGENSLHGGSVAGFDKAVWKAEEQDSGVRFFHFSPDGDGGYGGNLRVETIYTLTDDGLEIEFIARSDEDTPCNLTQHAYFNLGYGQTVLNQKLFINADKITKCAKDLVPHGEYLQIDGTPYSFKECKIIGDGVLSGYGLIGECGGYDFNYCINRSTERELEKCAWLYAPDSGIGLECYTTLPGLQLFTANDLKGVKGKKEYENYGAVCLETQFYPNSPNCANYPNSILYKNGEYRHKTVYKFFCKRDLCP